MYRVTKLAFATLLAFAGVLGGPAALAQGVTTAAINGQVVDETGEGLPGASVVAVHLPSGTRFGVATRSDGRYNLQGLRVGGPYAVSVSYIGYRAEERVGLQLALGQDFELNFQLRESGVEGEEVVVEGTQDATINSDRTGAQTTISQEQIDRLPTISRSLSDFTRLTPQSSTNSFNNTIAGRNNLYNNITIDGSVFNNVFGLSGEVGGQTNAQPISIDAVEQIQVSIAPFDVRQGSFTGAGINVVTRSGTNDFTGSAYTFVRSEALVSDQIEGVTLTPAEFRQNQYGFSLGGPLLKNRAFFFVNGELRRRTDPGATFRARTSADPAGAIPGVSEVNQSDLDDIRTALRTRFPDYDPGSTDLYDLGTDSDNLTARFDLNVNPTNRFSLRFNYLNSSRLVPPSNTGAAGGRQNSVARVPFSSTNYTINNDVYSVVGQLNSTFSNRFVNQATIGYTALRDIRDAGSDPFPLVDIENGSGSTITSLGFEQFTANNKLDTDIFQFSNNFTAFLGRHTVTLGTSNEFYSFSNGFTPAFYGVFRFRSVADFVAHLNAADPTAAGVPQPTRYELTYSALRDDSGNIVPVPFAEVTAAQLGFYAQDEIRAREGLKFTLGVRVDVPLFTSELPENPAVAALTFRDRDNSDERLDVSRLPKSTPLFSPRLGLNWDVFNDQTLQVRGGTGIFTGRIPFVWVSNQASNNGVLFGSTLVTGNGTAPLCQPGTGVTVGGVAVACQRIVFTDDVGAYIPENPSTPASVQINATVDNFKFPQVFRNNLAVDARLPLGFVATVEGLYTKDVNAVFHRNANLERPIQTRGGAGDSTFAGPDNRIRFAGNDNGVRINDNVTAAIVLDNVSEGDQYSLTGQLQKTFTAGPLDGLYGSFAYTYGKARDLTSSSNATAINAFNNNQVLSNPNNPILGISDYDQRHRLIGVASYDLELFGLSNTSLSVIYSGGSGDNYSYAYSGDMNGDRISGNDLIYVPKDATSASEIAITGATATRPESFIRAQLEAFIAQDPYLSEHRGEYVRRNAAQSPWVNRFDLGVKQQFFATFGKRRTAIELSFDLINLGNLFNSDWGVRRVPFTTQPIAATGVNAQGQPTFSFPLLSNGQPLTETFRTDTDLSSRWQGQFGLRVRF